MNQELFIVALLNLAKEIAEKPKNTSSEEAFLEQVDIFITELEKKIM
ncbi:hypothetical protein KHA93_02935 [Bacillus sp. FJAT-49732]|uniref:Uncharacterized protein n=1 Tax=Lederbergia citrisecunda TaxID=2833583 RepID=A0A942YIS4_9BACI|nr:hypothetical protein [Lederbergia citrisecunda]MBS4198603.1 hypothetical protein [Lederbergia citrisecunda]